tara:strand:- start:160099 stop:160323 length:225 start_codon:yes stop_codon:yes gene_type:complete
MSHIREECGSERRRYWALGLLAIPGIMLGGCITVKAPDKPIEINLNVKVQQEVVVRLQKDAQDLIENNPELFPE